MKSAWCTFAASTNPLGEMTFNYYDDGHADYDDDDGEENGNVHLTRQSR